jgi:sulfide:quinone oxidoreductase
VQWAKVAFEKYFLYKVKSGISEPFIERLILRGMKLFRVK